MLLYILMTPIAAASRREARRRDSCKESAYECPRRCNRRTRDHLTRSHSIATRIATQASGHVTEKVGHALRKSADVPEKSARMIETLALVHDQAQYEAEVAAHQAKRLIICVGKARRGVETDRCNGNQPSCSPRQT